MNKHKMIFILLFVTLIGIFSGFAVVFGAENEDAVSLSDWQTEFSHTGTMSAGDAPDYGIIISSEGTGKLFTAEYKRGFELSEFGIIFVVDFSQLQAEQKSEVEVLLQTGGNSIRNVFTFTEENNAYMSDLNIYLNGEDQAVFSKENIRVGALTQNSSEIRFAYTNYQDFDIENNAELFTHWRVSLNNTHYDLGRYEELSVLLEGSRDENCTMQLSQRADSAETAQNVLVVLQIAGNVFYPYSEYGNGFVGGEGDVGFSEITLRWKLPEESCGGFIIERTSEKDAVPIVNKVGTVGQNSLLYTELAQGTKYTFQITAVDTISSACPKIVGRYEPIELFTKQGTVIPFLIGGAALLVLIVIAVVLYVNWFYLCDWVSKKRKSVRAKKS